jgi:hypothetical protein
MSSRAVLPAQAGVTNKMTAAKIANFFKILPVLLLTHPNNRKDGFNITILAGTAKYSTLGRFRAVRQNLRQNKPGQPPFQRLV